MARNRVIYQSDAVFAGPTPATGLHVAPGGPTGQYGNVQAQMSGNSLLNQLVRVQSAAWSAAVTRQNVNQFGELAAIDQVILDQPNVSLDLTWIVNGLANEKYAGLTVSPTGSNYSVSCLSGILNKTSDEKNYFILQAPEGVDANNNSALNNALTNVHAFGNMFLSSYSTEGSVGSFPQSTIRLEGNNYVVQTGISQNSIPAVFPTDGTRASGYFYSLYTPGSHADPGTGDHVVSALRHGDITLTVVESGTSIEYRDLGAILSPVSGAIQGYRISYDLRRDNLQKLGNPFSYSKEVVYPLEVSASINGLVTDLNTGSLESFICNDKTYTLEVSIKRPGCEATRPILAKYRLLGAKLSNASYNLNIGSNKTFTYDFTAQIGSATQLGQGLFLSGLVGND